MISTWSLKHFKSVYEKIDLEMAPLTIFAGANSSGKSTVIQSLLLTAQTLQSPVYSRPVILNGHILRLGAFDDIASNNPTSDSILVGFKLAPNEREQKGLLSSVTSSYLAPNHIRQMTNSINLIECHYEFSALGLEQNKETSQLQPRLEECGIKINLQIEDQNIEEELLIRRSKKTIDERIKHFQLSTNNLSAIHAGSLEYEIIKATNRKRLRHLYSVLAETRPAGATLQHFLPGKIPVVFDAVDQQVKQFVSFILNRDEYRLRNIGIENASLLNEPLKKIIVPTLEECLEEIRSAGDVWGGKPIPTFLLKRVSDLVASLETDFSLEALKACLDAANANIRREFLSRLEEKSSELEAVIKGNRPPEYVMANAPLPEFSEVAVSYIHDFFSRRVKYLGPLRDEPKPVYPLAGATDPKDVGFRGEHTAAVLDVHRNTLVEYIPSKNFRHGDPLPTSSKTSLAEAVLDWLSYMGIASGVSTLDKGKLGHELKITTIGEKSLHDLTHVGVGVSQVLPILVISLLAEPGSTLVFEQPELHLHPRVQTRLADFFVSMTMIKKQSIVETHSEYLINRLRYQAAVSEGDQLSKEVIMYFVEKEKGHSTYRPVRINKFGVINDWPQGFFDENEENAAAILKASMDKRKKEQKNGNV